MPLCEWRGALHSQLCTKQLWLSGDKRHGLDSDNTLLQKTPGLGSCELDNSTRTHLDPIRTFQPVRLLRCSLYSPWYSLNTGFFSFSAPAKDSSPIAVSHILCIRLTTAASCRQQKQREKLDTGFVDNVRALHAGVKRVGLVLMFWTVLYTLLVFRRKRRQAEFVWVFTVSYVTTQSLPWIMWHSNCLYCLTNTVISGDLLSSMSLYLKIQI